jgi:hypothetical protein
MQHEGKGERARDRFIAEARRGGLYLPRMGNNRPTYQVGQHFGPEDRWLAAIGARVPRGSSITGTGTDEGRRYSSLHFARLVEASKVLCTDMAARKE